MICNYVWIMSCKAYFVPIWTAMFSVYVPWCVAQKKNWSRKTWRRTTRGLGRRVSLWRWFSGTSKNLDRCSQFHPSLWGYNDSLMCGGMVMKYFLSAVVLSTFPSLNFHWTGQKKIARGCRCIPVSRRVSFSQGRRDIFKSKSECWCWCCWCWCCCCCCCCRCRR